MISALAKNVREALAALFPNTFIRDEEYVNYKGQKLFFDFYVPALRLYVEVQGAQHEKFNQFFHGDASVFQAAKRRDRLKKEWCDLNDHFLVCVNYSEIPISTDNLLKKIEDSQRDG